MPPLRHSEGELFIDDLLTCSWDGMWRRRDGRLKRRSDYGKWKTIQTWLYGTIGSVPRDVQCKEATSTAVGPASVNPATEESIERAGPRYLPELAGMTATLANLEVRWRALAIKTQEDVDEAKRVLDVSGTLRQFLTAESLRPHRRVPSLSWLALQRQEGASRRTQELFRSGAGNGRR